MSDNTDANARIDDETNDITVEQQATFGDGGEIETGSVEVDTTLDQWGAETDGRDLDLRRDEPEASEFGVDDRPVDETRNGGEQSDLFGSDDGDQTTIEGEKAAVKCRFEDSVDDSDTSGWEPIDGDAIEKFEEETDRDDMGTEKAAVTATRTGDVDDGGYASTHLVVVRNHGTERNPQWYTHKNKRLYLGDSVEEAAEAVRDYVESTTPAEAHEEATDLTTSNDDDELDEESNEIELEHWRSSPTPLEELRMEVYEPRSGESVDIRSLSGTPVAPFDLEHPEEFGDSLAVFETQAERKEFNEAMASLEKSGELRGISSESDDTDDTVAIEREGHEYEIPRSGNGWEWNEPSDDPADGVGHGRTTVARWTREDGVIAVRGRGTNYRAFFWPNDRSTVEKERVQITGPITLGEVISDLERTGVFDGSGSTPPRQPAEAVTVGSDDDGGADNRDDEMNAIEPLPDAVGVWFEHAGQQVRADGGRPTTDEDMDESDLPENATVRLITGITGVMHSPEIIEGETSSTGKTIAVTSSTRDATKRLDTETILSGESEHRDSRYYELYTPGRLRNKQRSNHAPGPQAGASNVACSDDLPEPTHWPRYDQPDHLPDKCPQCGSLEAPYQIKRVTTPRCEACGELVEIDDSSEGDDAFDWVDSDALEEPTQADKWDLSQYGRGTVLTLDKYAGRWVVVNQKKTQFGDVTALDVVDDDDDVLRLRKFDCGGYSFDVRRGSFDGGTFREEGGTSVLRNVDELDDVQDFEVLGEDSHRLREWIRDVYYGDESGDGDESTTA